jgi:hypothetical protein
MSTSDLDMEFVSDGLEIRFLLTEEGEVDMD